MSDKTDLVLEILSDVLEAPADQRDALINKACDAQPALRAEVERLLHLGQRPDAHNFLDVPPHHAGLGAISDDPDTCTLPHFGRYRALSLIAQGGMGTVYQAQQDHPRRHVALKVIKPGMDTRQVIARFEAEREALALMNHPNIAAVYDAGVTEAGRPFFVMELVKGVPITRYCDDNTLPVRDRLHLFITVCKAVQHAHQKGIIHRDLKPSNVLVTLIDSRPVPKVIDFGIAKATTAGRLADHTLLTERREFIGTPQYMSPEQADTTHADIDTRSDIYSLGVLLYELLTGVTPFDRDQLSASDPDQMRRLIRETEPPCPSTRLAATRRGARAASIDKTIATARNTDPASLLKTLRGDLDWIVMKCLEKDRTRRYDTPNELAADLERFLRNQAVVAGPPSAAYRLRKFVRRNCALLAAAAAMFLLLIAGITGTTIGMLRARAAQQQSLDNERRATQEATRANLARTMARREAEQASALNQFLTHLFTAARPAFGAPGRDLKVVDLLDYAAANLPQKLHDHPEAEIGIRGTLAGTYGQLGFRDKCLEHASLAYERARALFGDDAQVTLERGCVLTYWLTQETPTPQQLQSAITIGRRVLNAAMKREKGDADPWAQQAAFSIGFAHIQSLEFEAAEQLYRDMLRTQTRDPDAAREVGPSGVHHGLAFALFGQQKLDQAEDQQRQTLRLNAQLPAGAGPRLLISTHRLMGRILAAQHRYTDAAQMFRTALESEPALGHRYPAVERTSDDYLRVLDRLGDYPRAAEFARRRLDSALADSPPDPALVSARRARLQQLLSLTWHPQSPP
jgi:serine/threonine protein kinase